MRIRRVTLYRYRLPLARPLPLRGMTINERQGLIVHIEDEDGRSGCGDIAPLPSFSPETLEKAQASAAAWIEHARNGEGQSLGLLPSSVRFGIESALIAMTGNLNAIGCDVSYERRGSVPVNALLTGSLEEVIVEAEHAIEHGYRAVKLKVGGRGVDEDIVCVLRVASIVEGRATFRLDANRAWTEGEATTFARGVAGCDIEYIEEPLRDPAGLAALASATGLPIAIDETLAEQSDAEMFLADKGWLTAVVVKPTLTGGWGGALDWIAAAKRRTITSVISAAFESGLGIAALAHLSLCAMPPDTPMGLDTYRWLAGDVFKRRFEVRNGALAFEELDACAATLNLKKLETVFDAGD